jgi:hypothetical protein
MDVWQGSVMDGITLRACSVLDPLSRRDDNVGQLAAVSASGRTPSSEISTTGGMGSSYYIPYWLRGIKCDSLEIAMIPTSIRQFYVCRFANLTHGKFLRA